MAKRFYLSMPLFVLPLTLVIWTNLSNGHIAEGYCMSYKMARVPPQCGHFLGLQSTRCARPMCIQLATMQNGHDMHAGLASLTIWPDPLSVLQLCISVDFVSYSVAWGFILSICSMFCTCTRSGSPYNRSWIFSVTNSPKRLKTTKS